MVVPIFETTLPNQSARKSGRRSGDQADIGLDDSEVETVRELTWVAFPGRHPAFRPVRKDRQSRRQPSIHAAPLAVFGDIRKAFEGDFVVQLGRGHISDNVARD
jgi:hypothetical protein